MRTVAAVAVAALLPAPGAWASSPGRDGKLAVTINCVAGEAGSTQYVRAFSPHGRDLGALTGCDANRYGPSWRPDGERLALVEGDGGERAYVTVPAAGGRPRPLGSDPVSGEAVLSPAPAFSPSGARFALVDGGDIFTASAGFEH